MDAVSVKPVQLPPAGSEPERARLPRSNALLVAGVALVAYAALAVLLFINTWVRPFTYSIGSPGDPPQMMWFLAWSPFALSHGHNPFFSTYIDYPAGFNLLWNCTFPLMAAILAPITAILGPVFSYNVLETLAVGLSAWTAFLFIRRYVRNPIAAGLGGLVYGFSPGMAAQSLGHPHVTLLFLPPLILLALDEVLRVQRRPPLIVGLLLGVMVAAQILIGEEMLATTALVVAIALVIVVAMAPKLVRPRAGYAIKALLAAGVSSLILAGPLVAFQFFGPQHIHGVVHARNEFVSDLWSFFVPTQMSLLAPPWAVHFTEKFAGNVSEWNSYVGIPMVLLLAFVAVRYWQLVIVRLATLVGVLIAILSMGVTIHYGGHVTTMPVFVLGLAFPLLARFVPGIPGLTMLYTTFVMWFAMARLPVFGDILPSRMMLIGYLAIGLLLAVFLEQVLSNLLRPLWGRVGVGGRVATIAGMAAAAIALIPMIPVIPYWSTPSPIPAFFTSGAANRVPEGSVALIVPISNSNEARPMLWQAATDMRFKMPEGYVFIPWQGGNALDPPYSVTQSTLNQLINGQASIETVDAPTRQKMVDDMAGWHVQTVIVGPMAYQNEAVALYSELLNRQPEAVGDVYVWWGVDASHG